MHHSKALTLRNKVCHCILLLRQVLVLFQVTYSHSFFLSARAYRHEHDLQLNGKIPGPIGTPLTYTYSCSSMCGLSVSVLFVSVCLCLTLPAGVKQRVDPSGKPVCEDCPTDVRLSTLKKTHPQHPGRICHSCYKKKHPPIKLEPRSSQSTSSDSSGSSASASSSAESAADTPTRNKVGRPRKIKRERASSDVDFEYAPQADAPSVPADAAAADAAPADVAGAAAASAVLPPAAKRACRIKSEPGLTDNKDTAPTATTAPARMRTRSTDVPPPAASGDLYISCGVINPLSIASAQCMQRVNQSIFSAHPLLFVCLFACLCVCVSSGWLASRHGQDDYPTLTHQTETQTAQRSKIIQRHQGSYRSMQQVL